MCLLEKHSCSMEHGEKTLSLPLCSRPLHFVPSLPLISSLGYYASSPLSPYRYTCSAIPSPIQPCSNSVQPTSEPSSLPTNSGGLSAGQICCFAYENVYQPGVGDWCTLTCPSVGRNVPSTSSITSVWWWHFFNWCMALSTTAINVINQSYVTLTCLLS